MAHRKSGKYGGEEKAGYLFDNQWRKRGGISGNGFGGGISGSSGAGGGSRHLCMALAAWRSQWLQLPQLCGMTVASCMAWPRLSGSCSCGSNVWLSAGCHS